MNNAAPRNAVKIASPGTVSLLAQLIAGAELTAPPACPELAGAGVACSGNGDTASAYLAPAATHWIVSPVSGEDFEVARAYTRRCR